MKTHLRLMTVASLLLSVGCTTVAPYDYTALQASKPRSILVLPPMNDSVDVNAPYTFLSTISKPLAEKGYYVFPVAVIDTFLKQNGMSEPADMHAIPLDKLSENIGPDAVLYVNINNWGQKYQLLTSTTVVDSNARLVDARTGSVLWESHISLVQGSNNSSSGLTAMLVGALVEQILDSKIDQTLPVSSMANTAAINRTGSGLLPGPYRSVAH